MDIDGQPPSPSSPINIQPLSVSSLSEIGEKCLYMVVNLLAEDYIYAVYRVEMSGITNSFCGSSNNSQPPPISFSSLGVPLLLLGREFPLGMVFFSFGSRIYMLGSSEGDGIIEYGSRSVHVFDTVTCTFGSAAYEQQMLTEKYLPVVIQPLKPFDDRVYVFSGDRCAEDLEVFYPDHQCQCENNSSSSSSSSSCWKFIGGPSSSTFPPDCLVDHHSTVSDGFVLLTRNNVVLLYNIPSAAWTVVEDQSHTTGLYLDHDHCAFAYEIAKWFYLRVSQPVGDSLLCSYFVDSKDGRHQFGKSPHLYLPDARPCQIIETDYLLYLGNLCFCVVRAGYDRRAGRRCSPDDPVANHHATVTLLRIDPSANSILEERSSSYKIVPLGQYEDDNDVAYVSACFVI